MKDNMLHLETSLYLLQHANNPVHWKPWSLDTLNSARDSNKLIVLSIGYSSCHWCHVMETESFENTEVAKLMNTHFINIKVDREERPDIDQIYMSALQLMGVQGGWPLNCVLLPDGRPIYGGTYFKKEKWMQVLNAIVQTYVSEPSRVADFAIEMQKNLEDKHYESIENDPHVSFKELESWIAKWKGSFDLMNGGYNYVPKFPLPTHLEFMLHYGASCKDSALLEHAHNTLSLMGNGGIFDHIEGGFSRYSTDAIWKVPHFEKMLYDNAQLMSLYSLGERHGTGAHEPGFYRSIVFQIREWLNATLKTDFGSFRCAQDADSEGSEGGYYCWTENELKVLLNNDFSWFKDLYGIRAAEVWENELFILQKKDTFLNFGKTQGWSESETLKKVSKVRSILAATRQKRVKPVVDTKSLTAWNALLIKGLCDAYLAFGTAEFLAEACDLADWLCVNQYDQGGFLYRSNVAGKPDIDAFLDDYALTIQALVSIYQLAGSLRYIMLAKELCETVHKEFYSEQQKLCFYTKKDAELIARKIDIDDDVIPSSNSIMAHNFYSMGHYFRIDEWIENSFGMLQKVKGFISKYPGSYVNWMAFYLRVLKGPTEISILGMEPISASDLSQLADAHTLISYHQELEMSSDYIDHAFYLCKDKTCLPKMSSIEELKNAL